MYLVWADTDRSKIGKTIINPFVDSMTYFFNVMSVLLCCISQHTPLFAYSFIMGGWLAGPRAESQSRGEVTINRTRYKVHTLCMYVGDHRREQKRYSNKRRDCTTSSSRWQQLLCPTAFMSTRTYLQH
jgi:hypothetical protein